MSKRFENLTPAQAELFERIASGDDTCVNDRVVAVLMERKLVEKYHQRDGIFTWFRYRAMPDALTRWQAWKAAQEVA